MSKQIKLGFTDYTTTVFIPDPASTDGSGKTGLVAANLTVSYTRVEDDNDVTVTDATSSLNNLAALTSTHNDWGVLEVSSTLAPGLYRLDVADAVFASGAWTAVVYVMITTSAAAASPIEFVLVAFNPLDGVRLGLTALPNAAADAAGGLPISDAGGLDLDAKIGALTFTVANKVDSNVTHAAGTAWGSGAITNASIANNAINDAKVDPDVTIASVTGAVGSVTGAVGSVTGNVGGNVTGTVGSVVGAVGSVTGNIGGNVTGTIGGIVANAVTASALAADAVSEIADGILNRDMSTGTDSGSPTVRTMRQALRFLRNKWEVVATTLTVYKEDDSTASWTSTVATDSGADPIVSNDPAS